MPNISMYKVNTQESINKNYSEKMCTNCTNEICKVYGGRCRKYNFKNFFKNFFHFRF